MPSLPNSAFYHLRPRQKNVAKLPVCDSSPPTPPKNSAASGNASWAIPSTKCGTSIWRNKSSRNLFFCRQDSHSLPAFHRIIASQTLLLRSNHDRHPLMPPLPTILRQHLTPYS